MRRIPNATAATARFPTKSLWKPRQSVVILTIWKNRRAWGFSKSSISKNHFRLTFLGVLYLRIIFVVQAKNGPSWNIVKGHAAAVPWRILTNEKNPAARTPSFLTTTPPVLQRQTFFRYKKNKIAKKGIFPRSINYWHRLYFRQI